MTNRISKRKIKEYIKWLEKKYEERSKEVEECQKINDNEESMIYDLRESYEDLAEYQGAIRASYYILNNC